MPLNTAWTPLRGWLRDGQSLPELSSVELLISLAQYDQVNEEHLLITTWSEPLTASDLTELTSFCIAAKAEIVTDNVAKPDD